MTAVYDSMDATGYEIANTTSYEDSQILRSFDGSSRKDTWKPILMRLSRANKRQAGKPADLPCRYGSLVLRRSAVDALRDILDIHGELLPLGNEDGVELFVFNTRFMIDALDMERSEIERIEGTPVVSIRKHVFIESLIRDVDIFRMPFGPRQDYFSDRFVDRVKKAKLKGTEFVKLWSSDDG